VFHHRVTVERDESLVHTAHALSAAAGEDDPGYVCDWHVALALARAALRMNQPPVTFM
jgi:hypothetical protein